MSDQEQTFQKLVAVIAKLRDPNGGCPWDLEQTHSSLKPYIIEESYEVLDAIDNNPQKLPEELGDVLLQVMLHSQIGRDNKTFTINDVVQGLTEKLIKRHPHVFGTAKAENSEQVLKNWEQIKKKDLKEGASMLDGIPRGMPSLLKAHRIGEKVARVGFDWNDLKGVKDKVLEELAEFVESVEKTPQDRKHQEEELGDLLFSLAQFVRKAGFNAEDLLNAANQKFIRRFNQMEKRAGKDLREVGSAGLEKLWQQVKADESK